MGNSQSAQHLKHPGSAAYREVGRGMRGEVEALYARYSSLPPCLASLFCSSSGMPLRKRRMAAVKAGERAPVHWAPSAMEADTRNSPSQRQISPK